MTGASAASRAIFAQGGGEAEVRSLQELHDGISSATSSASAKSAEHD